MDRRVASGLCLTVLNGRIIQNVIVWERIDANTGVKILDVLDGKQRLVSLYVFKTGATCMGLAWACSGAKCVKMLDILG